MAAQPRGVVPPTIQPQDVWRPTGKLSRRMTRLIIGTAMVSVLVGIVPPAYNSAVIHHSEMRGQLYDAIQKHQDAVKVALDVADAVRAQAAAGQIGQDADATAVRIMDLSGATIASFTRSVETPKAPDQQQPRWRRVAADYVPQFRMPELRIFRKIDINGDPLGSIEVTASSQPILYAVLDRLRASLVAVLIVAVFAAMVAARMSQRVAAPISRLLDQMDHVAYTQNYGVRAKPEGPDEVARLIIGFNEMLKHIQSRNQVLGDHRRKLHDLVVERTRSFERAAREAETASRAKGDFLARMSHEIRTPMNGVVGMAELLENTRLEEQQHSMLRTMRTSADSLLDIINDILDFSRIEAGQLQVIKTAFSPVDLFEEVCEMLAPGAHERNLELVCDIDSKVPQACQGDPIRLRQIVTNLLGNAVKYTEEGHIILRATAIQGDGEDMRLRIELEDTGLGISQQQIDTIFEAFTQGDTFETRKHGGTGLGLAITKQLVTLLGGEIGVTSTVGVGSKFWVELPVSAMVSAGAAGTSWNAGVRAALVVQEDEIAARATAAMLEAGGVEAYTATTGHRALERLAFGSFELVVIDELLPDMAGVELIDKLRSSPNSAGTPCILLTSSKPAAAKAIAEAQHSSQPDAILRKPIRRARLHDVVAAALNGGQPAGTERDVAARIGNLGMRVLLVEDSPVNREVAVGMLESLGCTVETAGDGSIGVEQALSWSFDAVMMDCQMPLMDGFEATRRIRAAETAARRAAMPIIALTANALQGDRERCLSSGMSDFISKPFTMRKLHDTLRAATSASSGDAAPFSAAPDGADGEALAKAAAPPGAGGNLPVVDIAQIDELRSLGRPEIIHQAVELFKKQAVRNLEDLDAALQTGSIADIERLSHSLKSSSLSIGGRRFAAAAGDCEHAANAGDLENAARLARMLWPEYAALYRRLQDFDQPQVVAA